LGELEPRLRPVEGHLCAHPSPRTAPFADAFSAARRITVSSQNASLRTSSAGEDFQ
jgi:hypothetical protein